MTTSQYKNIIDKTIKMLTPEEKTNSVGVAIKILKNSGISLLDAKPSEIKEVLASREYLGWAPCDSADIQDMANNGVAVIGVSDKRVVVVEPEIDGIEKSENENVVTFSGLSNEEISTMCFYVGGDMSSTYYPAGAPRRIAYSRLDPQWEPMFWGEHAEYSGRCNAIACISMASMQLDAPYYMYPKDIIQKNIEDGYYEYWPSWGSYGHEYRKGTTLDDLKAALETYYCSPETNAFPIVRIKDKNHIFYYISVFALDECSGIVHAIDPGPRGYDKTINRALTNGWRISDILDDNGNCISYQYYK